MKFSNTITPGDVIAVGDIHGRFDLLTQFVDWVKGTGAHVVFLGDLIDRGPDDVKVLELVKNLKDNPGEFGLSHVDVLRGNHEQLMLDATKGRGGDISLWIHNGGNFAQREQIFAHKGWVEKLPFFKVLGDTLFVHAGIRPGVKIEHQDEEDLLWIRQPFLDNPGDLSKVFPKGNVTTVVHGHTIVNPGKPDIGKNRIGIDSGAFFTGILTSFNSSQSSFKQFGVWEWKNK